jgi:hypothetical protein
MVRKIEIELFDTTFKAIATLLEKAEPELSNLLWKDLDTPLEMMCHHSQATGQRFSGRARPPKNPVRLVESRRKMRMCDCEPGDITYRGNRLGIDVTYGPVTEEALTSGPAAKADNIEDLKEIGKAIWESYLNHRAVRLTLSRKEK